MARVNLDRHSERATVPLRVLAEKDPCFASLSLFCHHRDSDKDFASAWTDGKTVFYSKAFADWKQSEKVAVCAHEIMHVAFGHIQRGKRLQQRFGHRYRPKLFNIVTDAIINETLREAGYRIPKEGVFLCELLQVIFEEEVAVKDALSKWAAESLYVLIDTYVDAISFSVQELCTCAGEGGGAAVTSAEQSLYDDTDDSGLICATCEQPISASAVAATYHYAATKGYHNDIDTSTYQDPLSPEAEQAESDWQERTLRAFATGQVAGRGVGTLGHLLADLPKSTTPWESILRTTIRKAVSHQRKISFSKPTRRWLAMDADAQARGLSQPAFEPGLHPGRSSHRVAVGLDVSGSISDVLLEKFAAEVVAIGKRTGAEIHVLVFDTKVISHTKMKHGSWQDQITCIEFGRGGGTDFHDVIEQAQELHPSIIVVLTDLYGPMGKAPGPIPVLWVCPSMDVPQPKFGKVLHLFS